MRSQQEILAKAEEIRFAYANAGYADNESSQMILSARYEMMVWLLNGEIILRTLRMNHDEYQKVSNERKVKELQQDIKEKKELLKKLGADVV